MPGEAAPDDPEELIRKPSWLPAAPSRQGTASHADDGGIVIVPSEAVQPVRSGFGVVIEEGDDVTRDAASPVFRAPDRPRGPVLARTSTSPNAASARANSLSL